MKVEKYLKKWSKYDVICSDHFVASDFAEDVRAKIMGTKPRIMLKEEAVPSKFLHSQEGRKASSSTSSRLEPRSSRRESQEVGLCPKQFSYLVPTLFRLLCAARAVHVYTVL